eukprot:Platyproteum_vivax@DN3554_c0_g1_i1.p1
MNQKIGMLVVFLSLINLVTALRISSLSQPHLKSEGKTDPTTSLLKDKKTAQQMEELKMELEILGKTPNDFEELKYKTKELHNARNQNRSKVEGIISEAEETLKGVKDTLSCFDSLHVEAVAQKPELRARLENLIQEQENLLETLKLGLPADESLLRMLDKEETDRKVLETQIETFSKNVMEVDPEINRNIFLEKELNEGKLKELDKNTAELETTQKTLETQLPLKEQQLCVTS